MLYAPHPFPVNDTWESPGSFSSSFCCSEIFLSIQLQFPCLSIHQCFHSHSTDRSTIYCFCFFNTVLSNSVIPLPTGSETFIKGLVCMQLVHSSFFLCPMTNLAQISSIGFLPLKALACWNLQGS
ncbi:hypothetical protein XELAEV_18007328mg [Xenopus laevis]|uniref:Uncharacterized protein n=1 Tax=Xenopus laevis TaxID=8355 RepID=A0A974I594_XENLA|nr:hypothetical protein XELAEV_18007328mg [Xenopus laevis]